MEWFSKGFWSWGARGGWNVVRKDVVLGRDNITVERGSRKWRRATFARSANT